MKKADEAEVRGEKTEERRTDGERRTRTSCRTRSKLPESASQSQHGSTNCREPKERGRETTRQAEQRTANNREERRKGREGTLHSVQTLEWAGTGGRFDGYERKKTKKEKKEKTCLGATVGTPKGKVD